MPIAKRIYTTEEAAEYLGLSRATLEAWRFRGSGPAFLKMGKAVRYRLDQLDAFEESRVRQNTSQKAAR